MSNNPILTIELVDDQRHLVNATTGYTWPEALNRVYPKDDSQPWTIQLTNRTDYYSTRSFNYTYYCGDGGLFSWSGSLFDCASFAVSSFLVQEKGYIVTKENARKVNQSFNVGELKTFDDTGVFKQMFSCTQASCQGPDSEEGRRLEDQFGPCGIDTNELVYNGGNPSGFLSSLEPLCLQVTREPEPDIAGPGITMAYFLQIALGAWFILFSVLIPRDPKASLVAKAARTLRRLRKRSRRQGSPREGRTESFLQSLQASRFSVALFSTVVEFQEAQVFFTLAVQLASISMIVFNDSISAIRIDWRAANVFQMGNTFVVLLVQAELQRRNMHWWYTYLLTLIVSVFCLTIQRLGRENKYYGFKTLSECGDSYTESILETCRFRSSGFGGYSIEYLSDTMFATVLISITFISFDQIAQTPQIRDWVDGRMEAWRRKSRVGKWILKTWSLFWSFLWFGMNCVLLWLLAETTDAILREVGDTLRKKDKWTFGQIVAVLLWAPVVFKYFYLNIFGVKEGVGNRIDSHYKVIRKGDDKPSQQSTDQIPLTSTGYKNVPNNEDGREYVGLEDPRTPKWGRQYSASSRDGASSVGITEPQSFPWSNSR